MDPSLGRLARVMLLLLPLNPLLADPQIAGLLGTSQIPGRTPNGSIYLVDVREFVGLWLSRYLIDQNTDMGF